MFEYAILIRFFFVCFGLQILNRSTGQVSSWIECPHYNHNHHHNHTLHHRHHHPLHNIGAGPGLGSVPSPVHHSRGGPGRHVACPSSLPLPFSTFFYSTTTFFPVVKWQPRVLGCKFGVPYFANGKKGRTSFLRLHAQVSVHSSGDSTQRYEPRNAWSELNWPNYYLWPLCSTPRLIDACLVHAVWPCGVYVSRLEYVLV